MIERLLIVRTTAKDGRSRNHFQWPLEIGSAVKCPDWDPNPRRDCGGGLHGLAWGHGDAQLLDWNPDQRWLVVEVDIAAGAVGSEGKCRFNAGTVLHVGDRHSAAQFLASEGARGAYVGGTATAGVRGTATAGVRGTATAGDGGTATAGDGGTATAGYGGTATAGDGGTATAGDGGTATAGYGGSLAIQFYDGRKERYRKAHAEVGEDGIKANTAYCVRDGKLVPVKAEEPKPAPVVKATPAAKKPTTAKKAPAKKVAAKVATKKRARA